MSILPPRALLPSIQEDLQKKMVFLGGPRQVGKTTLAQSLIPGYRDGHEAYLNWDSAEDRERLRARRWPSSAKLIVLDEIHKARGWRNMVKGLYDTLKSTHSFLVTGSARLDHFRKGGDSLLGRYHYYRLHPYSLPELAGEVKLNDLLLFGGFPEPLAARDERTLRRWHRSRVERLVRVDLRDLENIRDLDRMELLAVELPRRVGSPLSLKSLAEDLEIDPKTAKRWVELLDTLYYSFRIAPYGPPRIRAVKKEQKIYLWDWSQVQDEGARFENMMASQLLKFCHHHEDVDGHKMELRYIRDTDKREVDFVVLQDRKPLFAVECKLKDKPLSPHIPYFKERTPVPRFYQVSLDGPERQIADGVSILGFEAFCRRELMV
jgi:predicted AAA+ superfamily ATPase